MKLEDRILSCFSANQWVSMADIISLFPEVKYSTIRSIFYILRKKDFIRTRALIGKNGGLIHNSYQYTITEKGRKRIFELIPL